MEEKQASKQAKGWVDNLGKDKSDLQLLTNRMQANMRPQFAQQIEVMKSHIQVLTDLRSELETKMAERNWEGVSHSIATKMPAVKE